MKIRVLKYAARVMTKITEIMAEMAVFEALRHLLWPE